MTKKPKLTPWFPANAKPVHVGVYNASITRCPGTFRYWNGKHWSLDHTSPEFALWECAGTRTSYEGEIEWRGLAEKPE